MERQRSRRLLLGGRGEDLKNNAFPFLGRAQSALQIEEMEPDLLVRQDSWLERKESD